MSHTTGLKGEKEGAVISKVKWFLPLIYRKDRAAATSWPTLLFQPCSVHLIRSTSKMPKHHFWWASLVFMSVLPKACRSWNEFLSVRQPLYVTPICKACTPWDSKGLFNKKPQQCLSLSLEPCQPLSGYMGAIFYPSETSLSKFPEKWMLNAKLNQ